MEAIVLDLEWNGAYSKKAHGYFNEIIEIGATRLDRHGRPLDGFEVLIRPVVSRKLTTLVTDLTGIEQDSLKDGVTFAAAVRMLQDWIGDPQALILTWSTTDLLVLLENCRYFLNRDYIPFMSHYLDAQAYAQSRAELGKAGQQIGLAKAGEALGISTEGMDMHRAEDDSRLTACILEKLFDAESFKAAIAPADREFYKRLTFKTRVVSRVDDPLVKPEYLRFSCPQCGAALRPKGHWRFYGHMLCCDMQCAPCEKTYIARVQVKEKYKEVAVKRRLCEKKPPQEAEETTKKGEENHG